MWRPGSGLRLAVRRRAIRASTHPSLFRELFSYVLDILSRRWPIRIAGIAVKNEGVRFQSSFEFLPSHTQCQIVVIGADSIEFCAIAHYRSSDCVPGAGIVFRRAPAPAADWPRRYAAKDRQVISFRVHGEFHPESCSSLVSQSQARRVPLRTKNMKSEHY